MAGAPVGISGPLGVPARAGPDIHAGRSRAKEPAYVVAIIRAIIGGINRGTRVVRIRDIDIFHIA